MKWLELTRSGEEEQCLSRGCRGPRLGSNYNARQVESQPGEPGRLFKWRRYLGDVLWKCRFDGGTAEGHLLGDCDNSPGKGRELLKPDRQRREHNTEKKPMKEKTVRCRTRSTGMRQRDRFEAKGTSGSLGAGPTESGWLGLSSMATVSPPCWCPSLTTSMHLTLSLLV